MEQIEDESGNLTTVYTTANIEDIQIGDLVYSYNTQTGETELCEVTTLFNCTTNHLNYLSFTDESKNVQVIESTDAHPFWVVTDDPDFSRAARNMVDENGFILYHENLEPGLKGFWVEAKDLRVGDVFLGANGELSTLTNIVRAEQDDNIAVFNLAIDGNHNYFILAKEYEYGQTCVLVHNADPNFGVCPDHGGEDHNDAIDEYIRDIQLQGRPDELIDNIRKNQRQVDVNGIQLDLNRPDVQYDLTKDGIKQHHNVEFDRNEWNSLEHGIRIRGNDPDAIIHLFLIQ